MSLEDVGVIDSGLESGGRVEAAPGTDAALETRRPLSQGMQAAQSEAPSEARAAGRAARVRPYAITGGRTRFGHVLLVETLVSSLNRPADPAARSLPESEAICGLCRGHMRSIAEIAALLRIPLGVVRVLVSDLADQGRIRVHGAHLPGTAAEGDEGSMAAGTSNRELLERVLGGLRKL